MMIHENSESGKMDSFLEKLFCEKVERFTLSNGLTVLLKEDHANKIASVQVWVKTGSIYEDSLLGAGVSHFLEHMLFKGTERRAGEELTREIQAAGAYINAYTTFDRTVYYIETPSEETGLAIDILADAALCSILPVEEVAKEREVILREIDMGEDDPDRQVSRALFRNAFREHPYRYPVIGHRELFETLSREDLLTYYQTRYVPNNMALVVVGDFCSSELRDEIEKNFGSHARKRLAIPYVPDEPLQLSIREEHLEGEVNVCRGNIAFRIPGLAHEDTPGCDILAAILGSGYSSILWQQLRDKRRIVHYIDASCWNPGNVGFLSINYVCDPDKQLIAQNEILDELTRLGNEGIRLEQVDKAVRQAVVGEVSIRKTVSGQASRLGMAEIVVGDLGYPRNYIEKIHKLGPEAVSELIGTYFRNDRMTAVSLNAMGSNISSESVLTGSKESPDFKTHTLDNGVRIVFQPDNKLPKVHIKIVSLGGAIYENDSQRGITSLLSTLLTRDTRNRNAEEVAETIERVGGSFNEFIGDNTFGLSMEVMSQDYKLALELLDEALHGPDFDVNTFNTERTAQIAMIKEENDEIVYYGLRKLRELFYCDHPFKKDSSGSEETLEDLNVSEISDHYDRLIRGRNIVAAIVGDFDPESVIPKFESHLNKFPERDFTEVKKSFLGPSKSGLFEFTLPREQAVVFQAYQGAGILSDDIYVSKILDELFSNMSGRLFERVREKRSLAYFVGAQCIVGLDHGMFYLYAGTHPSKYNDVIDEFNQEISRVKAGGVSEDELRRAQTRLKAQKRMGMQTIGARATMAALNIIYGKPANEWKQYDERIQAITLDDLVNFSNQYFNDDRKINLVVKP